VLYLLHQRLALNQPLLFLNRKGQNSNVKTAHLKNKRELAEAKLQLQLQEAELQLEEQQNMHSVRSKVLEAADAYPEIGSSSSVISAHVKRLSRPKIEIRKFSGNPMEYRRFLRQLETQVFVNCESDDDELSYLDQYTTGELNKIVRG